MPGFRRKRPKGSHPLADGEGAVLPAAPGAARVRRAGPPRKRLLPRLRWGRRRRSPRCQRGLRFTGWLERRVPIKIVHYLGEGLVFFIALSGGGNLLVLQFQWLKRQFTSSRCLVKGFFFFLCVCVCFLGKISLPT